MSLSRKTAWIIQTCDNCSENILTLFPISWGRIALDHAWSYLAQIPTEVYPYYSPSPDSSLPREIADDYIEVVKCYSVGSYNASVTMSRRAIETAAILKGANAKDDLRDKIKWMSSVGVEQSLIDLSTEIRLLGNTGAHVDKFDLLRNVTKEDCEVTIKFLEQFLEAVYIRPARISELRKKRSKKP
jgi:hypothetical protein